MGSVAEESAVYEQSNEQLIDEHVRRALSIRCMELNDQAAERAAERHDREESSQRATRPTPSILTRVADLSCYEL